METRRFVILYQRHRNETLEQEVVGAPADAVEAAWAMLQDGRARVAAVIEPGNLDFHVWHHRIVGWGQQHGAAAVRGPTRPAPHRTAA
jgi:hypothetical protein